jgi:holliday junction DNA helicase RuvA
MIGWLKGTLAQKSAERVIIDVGGVGYEVLIPLSTFYELGEAGSPVELKIHTHVREDALQLFGFRTAREKQVFLQLIQISGIGPRLAVTILSGLALDDFLEAVVNRDVARLATIPGVGKKTAERIALEMKDRIKDLPGGTPAIPAMPGGDGVTRDVVSALVNLGYQRSKAEAALSRLRHGDTQAEPRNFETMLKKALRELSG